MPTLLERIPELTLQPGAPRPAAAAPAARTPAPPRHRTTDTSRRGFLRIAITGAAALALSGLGWLADRVPAFAATRTSMHPTNCMGVDISGDVPCWGRDYISKSYCASDKYHRTDQQSVTGGYRKHNWEAACGSYAGWSWRMGTGQAVTCFDGYFDTYIGGLYKGRSTTCCKSV